MFTQIQKRPFSFGNYADLRSRIEILPGGSPWLSQEMKVVGDPHSKSLMLYYRNSLDVFKSLFGDAKFAGLMEFEPQQIWKNKERVHRIYSGIMSGDWAWRAQVCRDVHIVACVPYLDSVAERDSSRSYPSAGHNRLGQNTSDTVNWFAGMSRRFIELREYTSNCSC